MAERARKLGWTSVEVIDNDLGSSAAVGASRREGFERVMASVALGEVGIVLSREVSRLSRTDRDWCRLLEVCQVFDTLIGDDGHVYDLTNFDDQLVLGIKATGGRLDALQMPDPPLSEQVRLKLEPDHAGHRQGRLDSKTGGGGKGSSTVARLPIGDHRIRPPGPVDGGVCVVESPVFNVAHASTLSIWYFHGQRDAGDDAAGDFFLLEVSTKGGASYSPLVSIGDVQTVASWTEAVTAIPAGSNVRLRLQVSDGAGPGDIVEGGVDDLSICPQ